MRGKGAWLSPLLVTRTALAKNLAVTARKVFFYAFSRKQTFQHKMIYHTMFLLTSRQLGHHLNLPKCKLRFQRLTQSHTRLKQQLSIPRGNRSNVRKISTVFLYRHYPKRGSHSATSHRPPPKSRGCYTALRATAPMPFSIAPRRHHHLPSRTLLRRRTSSRSCT
jgi:hypothetical protein